MIRRHPRRVLVALLAVVSAIALAACGSSSNDKGSNNGGGASVTPQSGQEKGGTLKVQSVDGFEHLDPGSSYFQLEPNATQPAASVTQTCPGSCLTSPARCRSLRRLRSP